MTKPKAATLRCDASGKIAFQDRHAKAWFGDCVGMALSDLFVGADAKDLVPDAASGRPEVVVDDRRVPVRVHLRTHGDGLEVHLVDDSAAVQAQERQAQEVRQLKEAQATAGVGSWEWDIPADQITWTDELFRIYGQEPQAFTATYEAYLERIHPEDKEMAMGVVQQAFETGEPFSFDHRIVRADNGEVRWLHGQGAVETEDGRPVRMYGVSQDITAMREAEEARAKAQEREAEIAHLKRLDAERRRLLNTMAHELKTPLTPLSIQVQLLAGARLGDLTEQQSQSLHILEQNLSRLQALVGDILDSARIEEGHLELHRQDCDLAALVADAAQTFTPQAEAQGIRLRASSQGEEVHADVDPHRITQVLYNLLSNALKFTPEGGHVDVDLEAGADKIRLHVRDDGAGLKQDQIARMFHPFSQVHEDKEAQGTGLGLHICKGLIEQHGGTITVTSKGPGKGSRFEVVLPRHETPLQRA